MENHVENQADNLGHVSQNPAETTNNSVTTWQSLADEAYAIALTKGELAVINTDTAATSRKDFARAVHDAILAIVPQSDLGDLRRMIGFDPEDFLEDDPFRSRKVENFLKRKGIPVKEANDNIFLTMFQHCADRAYSNVRKIDMAKAAKDRTGNPAYKRSVDRWAQKVAAAIDMANVEVLDWSFATVFGTGSGDKHKAGKYDEWCQVNPTLTWTKHAKATAKPRKKADLATPGGEKPDDDDDKALANVVTLPARIEGAETPGVMSVADLMAAAKLADATPGGTGDTIENNGTQEAAQADPKPEPSTAPANDTEAVQNASETDTANTDSTKPVRNTDGSITVDMEALNRRHEEERAQRQRDQDELFGYHEPSKTETVKIKLTKPNAKTLELQPGSTAFLLVSVDEDGDMIVDLIKHRH